MDDEIFVAELKFEKKIFKRGSQPKPHHVYRYSYILKHPLLNGELDGTITVNKKDIAIASGKVKRKINEMLKDGIVGVKDE